MFMFFFSSFRSFATQFPASFTNFFPVFSVTFHSSFYYKFLTSFVYKFHVTSLGQISSHFFQIFYQSSILFPSLFFASFFSFHTPRQLLPVSFTNFFTLPFYSLPSNSSVSFHFIASSVLPTSSRYFIQDPFYSLPSSSQLLSISYYTLVASSFFQSVPWVSPQFHLSAPVAFQFV